MRDRFASSETKEAMEVVHLLDDALRSRGRRNLIVYWVFCLESGPSPPSPMKGGPIAQAGAKVSFDKQ